MSDENTPLPDQMEAPKLSMTAKLEDTGPCKKKLAIEVSAEEVNAKLRDTIGELQKSAALPGFRRGRAPIALIEKRFGEDIRKDVKSNLVAESYRQALAENTLEPIADPELNLDSIEMNEGEAMKFELTVEVWPEFAPEGYEGLKLEKPSSEPTEEETEAEVKALQTRTTTFEDVEGEAAGEEDFVICDYTITAGENEIADRKDAGVRPVDENAGRFKVKGLKKALVGKNIGETINIDFKIDKEHFQEELREQDASLSLSIKSLRRPNVPEATDEWAKELGFESLEELKTVVGRNVAAQKEQAADSALRGQVYDKLLELITFELPEDAVRRQQKDIIARERTGLQYRGATEEDLAKISDELEEASLEHAERDLKVFFILSRIATKEAVSATGADVEMRIAELAARYRTTVAKMRQQLEKEGALSQIALQVQEEKTVAHILSKAEITEAAPEVKEEKPKAKKKAAKKPAAKKSAKKSAAKKSPAKKAAKAKEAKSDKGEEK